MNRTWTAAVAAAATLACSMAAAQQPITLKFASPAPPRSYLNTEVFPAWAEQVAKDSGGTLKFENYFGGQLGNFGVMYDRTVDGVADIGFIVASFTGGKFRMHEVAALPFEAPTSPAAGTALWRMYEKGVTTAEFSDVRPLAIWVFSNATIHSKDLIKAVSDMKGKKITAGNSATGKIVAAAGAAPIVFRPDELYQVLQRGTADGSLIGFSAVGTFKLGEVVHHHLNLPLGTDPAMLIINRRKYDSLPPQAKAALDRNSGLALSQKIAARTDQDAEMNLASVKDRVTPLTPQEVEGWRKALAPVAQSWAKEVPNGAKVLAAFRAEVKAYQASKK